MTEEEKSLTLFSNSELEQNDNGDYRLPKISKQEFFSYMDNNLAGYRNLNLTGSEEDIVRVHLRGLSTGVAAAMPLYCAADRCPFARGCVLVSLGKAPEGDRCPIENQLLNEFSKRYFEELQVNPNSMIEVSYIRELAKLDILELRINNVLSRPENAELTMEQPIGITDDGDAIMKTEISPYLKQLETIANRKTRIIKLMVGDRQEKYKKDAALKKKDSDDISILQADMRKKLQEMSRHIDSVTAVNNITYDDEGNAIIEQKEDDQERGPKPLTPDDIFNDKE